MLRLDEKLKVGDLVRLKSGGPVMTVRDVNALDNHYWCQWFAGKKLELGNFPGDSLIDVNTEPPQVPQ